MTDQRTPEQIRASEKFGASVGQFGPAVLGQERFEAEQAALKAIEGISVFGPGVLDVAAKVLEPTAVEKVVERLQHQHQDDPRSRAVNAFGPAVGGVPTAAQPEQEAATARVEEQPSQPPDVQVHSGADEAEPARRPVSRTGRGKK